MTRPKPLTEDEILLIAQRCKDGEHTRDDIGKLLENSEALSDMLADCWMALDELARTEWTNVGGLVEAMVLQKRSAKFLLQRQKCPGWK